MRKIKALSEASHNIRSRPPYGEDRVLACSRCGSRNIILSSGFNAWFMPKRYFCEDRRYVGSIVLESDEEEEQ